MSEIIQPTNTQMISETKAAHQGGPLPEGNTPVEAAVAPAPELVAAAPVEEEEVASETQVEVDGQKFASERDAFEFLQGQYGQLKTESMIEQARLQGIQEAMSSLPVQQAAPVATPDEPVIDMDKFYEDPAKYLLERDRAIEERLMGKVSAAQTNAAREQQTWNNFTNKYPDLADFQTDVEQIANEHLSTVSALAKRDQSKAMDFVALKVREKFQRYAEALKPNRELTNSKAGVSVGGNPVVTTTTSTTNNQKPVDFVAEMRSMKK